MATVNHSYKSRYNLVTGLRGLLGTVITGVTSTLNLQVAFRDEGYRAPSVAGMLQVSCKDAEEPCFRISPVWGKCTGKKATTNQN